MKLDMFTCSSPNFRTSRSGMAEGRGRLSSGTWVRYSQRIEVYNIQDTKTFYQVDISKWYFTPIHISRSRFRTLMSSAVGGLTEEETTLTLFVTDVVTFGSLFESTFDFSSFPGFLRSTFLSLSTFSFYKRALTQYY